MTDDCFQLFHGTTLAAAQRILALGFEPNSPHDTVTQVANQHGLAAEDLWKILDDEPQFYLNGAERSADISFTPSFDSAAHSWAQRAPEARREALWAAWMYMHPDRLDPFHWNVDGQAWVLAHMVVDEPVVIGIEVSSHELIEWGAVGVSNGHRGELAGLMFMLEHEILPEVALPHDLHFPPEDLFITPVSRQVEWQLYAHLLDADQPEFEQLGVAGHLGRQGVGYSRGPYRTPWWPLETVNEVLERRGRPVEWTRMCECLG